MNIASLVMKYPVIASQLAEFKFECEDQDDRHYQIKWLWPNLFPFKLRLKVRYLPSKVGNSFKKELPLSI